MAKTEYNEQERHRVGELLKEIRMSKYMSLRDAGSAAGIDHNNVAKIEAARYSVTLDTLSSLARAYGMRVTFEDM